MKLVEKKELRKVVDSYSLLSGGISINVNIVESPVLFVREYLLDYPEYGRGTIALFSNLKKSIIRESSLKLEKMLDPDILEKTKKVFQERIDRVFSKEVPEMPEKDRKVLGVVLLQEMLGLGKIEFLLNDSNLEEIVLNESKSPVWVYHKKFGWLRTNVFAENESEIENYANIIARGVGKQITILNPLLDAHLVSGDRANATLFPISTNGNTITIRRFRRDPWTVTDFIKSGTANSEVMALLWTAIEYELNIVIAGGTASGKTSLMNVLMPFIQPNHRIISIEDTRELKLPEFLHWVPLTTREPNPEGKGEVSMLDLLVNSLRMRPDRIIVGEIRRQQEAEVMFEAMHTGHSVYTTFHANTAEEVIRRMVNPPIEVPSSLLEAVNLTVVMFRNRRLGTRRVLQVAENIAEKRGLAEESVKANVLYRWRPSDDYVSKHNESIKFYDELSLHTGLSNSEIDDLLKSKQKVLDWLVEKNIHDIESVGKYTANYYLNPENFVSAIDKGKDPLGV